MTKEERHLWYDYLNTYPIRFRRQEIIGKYIADFYCDRAKLVIELDGSQHYDDDAVKKDEERTAFINSQGIELIRVSNLDVMKNFEGVCLMIDTKVKERCANN